ncbi:hypothetical protein [Brevundimonas aveniformis]|uniref:hypothetical protein n=1 Tax=Brevundimonas aveniformis TaxID=370977 RepID=UPI002492D84D|nr:hypothetical protein [Brevundimonas aveniformis]
MIQEPAYARPNNTASTWTATDRTYVLGPLPDERLIWMEGRGGRPGFPGRAARAGG